MNPKKIKLKATIFNNVSSKIKGVFKVNLDRS